jgi:hypothetical protein
MHPLDTSKNLAVYIRLADGRYLGAHKTDGPVLGEAQIQSSPDDWSKFFIRTPSTRGPCAGPTQADAFHLYHPATDGALCWRGFGETFLIYNYYYTISDQDMSGVIEFNFTVDGLGNHYYAINNHDHSHVMDQFDNSSNVGAWTWNGGQNQRWQLIGLNGLPVSGTSQSWVL